MSTITPELFEIESSAQRLDVKVGSLPAKLKAGWAVGAFGAGLLVNGIAMFIFFYLVSILHIEPALAGGIVFVAKIIDVVLDPVVGVLSDRSSSPRGRRRPFLPWGAVLSAASLALIFSVPEFARPWMTTIYVFAALTLYTLGYTLFNIPYMAMPAEMTDSYHERSSIHGYRIVAVTIATFVATSIAPYGIEKLGRKFWGSYALLGLIGSALVLVSMLTAYFATASARFTKRTPSVTTALGDFRTVLSNRHFLRLIAVKLAQLIGFQTTSAALLFYIVQSLHLGFDVLLVLGLVTLGTSAVATPLILRFARLYGKRAGYYLSSAVTIVNALSWTFAGPGEPMWALAIRSALSGIAFSGNVMIAMSMLTDIINYDARQTGERHEGAFTALYSFVEKLTAAVGPLIIGVTMSAAGFNSKLPPEVPQGDGVKTALLFAVSWLPAAMGVVAVWLLSGYKLTEADVNGTQDGADA